MQAVKAYYDGRAFVPTMPVNVKKNRTAIITILDDELTETAGEQSKKPMNENTDWIGGHFKAESFTPLSRDEANERAHIYCYPLHTTQNARHTQTFCV